MKRTPLARSSKPMKRSRLQAKRLDPAEVTRRRQVREAVFARDGRRCQLAGAGPCFGGLTFHHRRKASQGGAYTEDNGSTLCAHHNDSLESDADLAALGERLGLVVRRV